MKYASIGSISSGTLRTEDLLSSFAFELEDLVQRNASAWWRPFGRQLRDAYMSLIGAAREVDPDSEAALDVVEELADALAAFAPPYCYFGAHADDAAAYGFWLSDMDDFDGLRVADTSEVPKGYSGDVLHVNDHGNITLYRASRGKLSEVWSIV